ncbi:MAG: M14 family zinc carboxypeptidase, partial [Tangfeifania sp.]
DTAEFDPKKIREAGKSVLLINNGIHPGEPEGIDASLQFADDLLRSKKAKNQLLQNTAIVIIPVYNIGGHLHRSAFNRANQTTPIETGFRGNAANLDLNRDFTKCDSENAKSFTRIFHEWNPDVFLDTHTTNGSDHQYSITLVGPQPDRFPPAQEQFIREKMLPSLYGEMKKSDYEMVPYVNWVHNDPKSGIQIIEEFPRYSSGFATLFHTYGMMTENHVYKPYADRVKSCNQFIWELAEFTAENSKEIMASREQGIKESLASEKYPLSFELDSTQFSEMEFKGYEVDENQVSPVTGLKRFGYDKSKPFTAQIKIYDEYKSAENATIPDYYILPQAWKEVANRLELNNVEFFRLKTDTILEVQVDYIVNYSSPEQPSNGHYFHYEVETRSEVQQIQYFAGDYLIPVRQDKIKYIVEMLEPKASDSFFRWNFFDSILDNREYFSSFGFEENALKYLEEHPEFKKEFQEKQRNDTEFAKNHRAQLAYIYNNTEWFEATARRYPVGRIFEPISEKNLSE